MAVALCNALARASQYVRRHGFRAACARLQLSVSRGFFRSRFDLFYYDLRRGDLREPELPPGSIVERRTAEADLHPAERQTILYAWNPRLVTKQLKERFGRGASLWLFKLEDSVACYGWSIVGRTVEPHFFPLASNDLHLFDFFVFPQHRGRRINPSLVNHILAQLASETDGRAFIEAAEWNHPQLSSLRRTPFLLLGRASKRCLFGRTIVTWSSEKGSTNAPQNPV